LALTVYHGKLGVELERDATALITNLIRQMKALLGKRVQAVGETARAFPLHRICLHERIAGEGLITQLVMHVPDPWKGTAETWMRGSFLPNNRQCGQVAEAVRCNFEERDSADARARIKRHWDLVRPLWRSLPAAACADGIPLLDRLKVLPSIRKPSDHLRRRLNMSQSLTDKARLVTGGLPPLSAWQDQEWDWLFKGWELKEHEDRIAEVRRRSNLVRQLEQEIALAPDPLSQKGLETQLRSLQADWHQLGGRWERRWQGWW
jgi:hypothetical protein